MENLTKLATVAMVGLIFLLVGAGCQKKEDVQTYNGGAAVRLKRITWEGHTYITDQYYRHGGLAHDPDCVCNKAN